MSALRTRRPAAGTPTETAWLLVVPCGLVLVAAIALLGPPLADVLFPPSSIAFWPTATPTLAVRPEPVEHARYLLALAGPFLVAGAVALLRGSGPPRSVRARTLLSQVSQAALAAFLALAVIVQHTMTYDASYSGAPFRSVYFTWPAIAVAIALTLLALAALRRAALVERLAAAVRETPRRRLAAVLLASLLSAAWLLTAVNTEGTIRKANIGIYGNVSYWLDETFAVLDRRAPLVDFHAQYSQLWPYLTAGAMALLGSSFGVWVAVMIAGSAATLAALYATLRRVLRSSLLALALYLPVLATGFFMEVGPPGNRYGPSNLFSIFPMRYGGPYALAWLTVRHVQSERPRAWARPLLLLGAGIALIANVEFGAPAFAATLAALLWSGPRPSLKHLARLAGEALAGLLGAAALVALLTLAVAGALPRFGTALTFSRLWGIGGVTMLPMPTLGFHLAIYVTFAAAIVVATVRAIAGEEDHALTAMLAWAGVFGLGAGSYFAGRSHPEVLIDLFSAWALALALLVVVAVRAILARPSRRPTIAEVAVLAGFGLAVCSLAQIPTPTSQLARLRRHTPQPALRYLSTQRFIAADTRRGERVAILTPLGHRLAYELGLVNVAPYAIILSMPAEEQLQETIDALRAAHGQRIFLRLDQTLPVQLDALARAGFRKVRSHEAIAELRASG